MSRFTSNSRPVIFMAIVLCSLSTALLSVGCGNSVGSLPRKCQQVTVSPTIGPLWPEKINGDCNFWGNGPEVDVSAEIRINDSHELRVDLYMHAKETWLGQSEAEGRWTECLYIAPEGWKITKILVDTVAQGHYVDEDTEYDRIEKDLCTFEIMGDTRGYDICGQTEDDTHINVIFNPIEIEICEE
jgi:hypothetical protein